MQSGPSPYVLAGSTAVADIVAAELEAAGWHVVDSSPRGWRIDGRRMVVRVAVTGEDDARAALLAGARGAGLLLVAPADHPLRPRLYEDLSRLGPVAVRDDDGAAVLGADEQRILALLAGGATLDAVAREIGWSRRTVIRRLAGVRECLGVRTNAEAVAKLRGS